MSPLPKRAVIAVTSANAPLYSDKETTGVFISEALHPFLVFREAGFEVDIVSETGKYTPDDLSLTPNFLGGSDKDIYEDPQSEFRQKLDNMPKPADLDNNSYGIFFASAGHAALIDYPTASGLQKIAEDVWANGGVVASVCHGVAIFANVKDRATGKPIISGKTVTGFTNEGEDVLKVMSDIKSWGKPLVEEHAEALGATYQRPDDVWGDFHVVSGRLVTGTNPQSSTSTAKAVLDVYNSL
ncbi:class I glutamine amidotransferase-like protein [Trichoderma sp. SZMC 28014]